MYYAEKVINGILHYQTIPNGDWHPFTLKELTGKYLEVKCKLALERN